MSRCSKKTSDLPLILRLYLMFSAVNGPLYGALLLLRILKGKEDRYRISERFGTSATERPVGPLIWFHAASVGESLALIVVIKRLLAQNPSLHVLVTTNTLTSASILAQALPDRAFHQFQPVDTVFSTRRFLKRWQPVAAVWTESELWPRLMTETARAGIPMILINARVSERTKSKWRKWHAVVSRLLNMFRTIAVQDAGTQALMVEIGVTPDRLLLTGSTKEGSETLDFEPDELARFQSIYGNRPLWLAASTHPGEEELILEAHRLLAKGEDQKPALIIVPRHPHRGSAVRDLAQRAGFETVLRTESRYPSAKTDVFVADTMAELGLWYRLAKVSFVGGSLAKVGGHNPFEPIALGSAVLTGPHFFNFADIYQRLDRVAGCKIVTDAATLSDAIRNLHRNEEATNMAAKAALVVQSDRSATDKIVNILQGML